MRARKVRFKVQITQATLEEVETLRSRKSRLASELRETEALLAQREREVMDALTEGQRVEPGKLSPAIGQKTVCSPSYKDELVAHFAQAHGIDAKLVEEQVRKRWTTTKEVLNIYHSVTFEKPRFH